MQLKLELTKRLRAGGWSFERENGKHEVWRHPNGAVYILPRGTMSDTGRRREHCFKNIERLEKKP